MKALIGWLVFLGAAGGFVYLVAFSDEAKHAEAAQRAQERADAKPHVIREADGCKVYAFKAGDNWHYFTRCEDGSVTTERNWAESRRSGKRTITEHKSESIVTNGNQ